MIKEIYKKKLKCIQKSAMKRGLDRGLIRQFNNICYLNQRSLLGIKSAIISIGIAFIAAALTGLAVEYLLSARCLIPINHLVWEVTRPLADCNYCANITKPIILQNITRRNFRVGFYMIIFNEFILYHDVFSNITIFTIDFFLEVRLFIKTYYS